MLVRKKRGRVVSASDSQSGGPGFESRSGYLLDFFSIVPSSKSLATLVNSQQTNSDISVKFIFGCKAWGNKTKEIILFFSPKPQSQV